MKFDWNKKYTTIALYSVIVIASGIMLYLGLTKFTKLSELFNTFIAIIRPFIIGFSLAYLFNFMLAFYEDKIILNIAKKGISHRKMRTISLLMTYFTVCILVYLFIEFILPEVAASLSSIITDFPRIVNKLYLYTDSLISSIEISGPAKEFVTAKIEEIGKQLMEFATNLMPYLANTLLMVLKSIWNLVLGIIISVYVLADKESFYAMCKKFIRAVFSTSAGDYILYVTDLSNDMFGKFIVGKIIDSTIIGAIAFIVLYIVKMPYLILITFIIGVTNIIPFFGPFIGAVPSIILVLFVSPIKALWLTIIIFIIQQLDGNVIGPKILGGSLGISSFWILFSLLLAGKFFGLIGMVLGVPLFAVIHTLAGETINDKLVKKGLPTSKEEYK